MPIFGSKSSFAVEANAIEPDQRPSYPGIVFGHFCFWAGDQRLGCYDEPNILGTPTAMLSAKLAFQGRRKDIAVDGKSKEEVLALIHNALYELETDGEEKTDAECSQLSKRFSKFDICLNSSEALDGIFAVLVDMDDGSRFIWRENKSQNVQEVKLAAGEYEAAIRAFLRWQGLISLSKSAEHENY